MVRRLSYHRLSEVLNILTAEQENSYTAAVHDGVQLMYPSAASSPQGTDQCAA